MNVRVTTGLVPTAVLSWALLALGGCMTTQPQDDPVQIRLNDLDKRLTNVQRVVDNQSLVQLSQRIDALEAQLRQLRGSAEEQQNASESLRKQQRDLYGDLNNRLTALEQQMKAGGVTGGGSTAAGSANASGASGASTGTSGASGPGAGGNAVSGSGAGTSSGPASGPASDDQAAYQRAFDTLKGGDYAGAVSQFTSFMQTWPNSALIDNAQYWQGEAYYVNRDYEHAAGAFRAVGQRWPNSRKAPDALLKLGYTLIEQKRYAEARTTLSAVSQRYPGSDAAKLAADKLQKLPADAH